MPRPKNPTPPRGSRSNRTQTLKTRGVYANVKLDPVPFDPSVDCPPYACFNCRVLDEHLSKDCRKPVCYKFCVNCGRRGVDVRECPRCGKGFIDLYGPRPFKRAEVKPTTTEGDKKPERKLPVGMSPPKATKKKRTKSSNSQSSAMSPEKVAEVETQKRNSISDSAVGSEIGDEYFIVDDCEDEDLEQLIFYEDLDDLVIDEEEIPEDEPLTSSAVQSFVGLIELMKHLPIETQNMVIAQFAEEKKVLSN